MYPVLLGYLPVVVRNGVLRSELPFWACTHQAGRGRLNSGPGQDMVWVHVSAESKEGLGERRPSQGDLGTALYGKAPDPLPHHTVILDEETVHACLNCFI